MSREGLAKIVEELKKTNFTNVIHQAPYPAISPTRPELSQAGKSILITGGGTGVGFGIAKSFVRAAASCIIILARRAEVLDQARIKLETIANDAKTGTKIIIIPCDITDFKAVDNVWEKLAEQSIAVDVFVANAAKLPEPKPLLEIGSEEVWSQMETNVKSPFYLTEKFMAQGGDKQKFIVNVSTASVHGLDYPIIKAQPAYTLTKMAGTLLFQLLASDNSPDRVQIVNIHPGLVLNDFLQSQGVSENDNLNPSELAGSFAVWAASKEAAFLHGRYVWCTWDVDELATGEIRKRIDEDPYFLRSSIVGLRQGMKA